MQMQAKDRKCGDKEREIRNNSQKRYFYKFKPVFVFRFVGFFRDFFCFFVTFFYFFGNFFIFCEN